MNKLDIIEMGACNLWRRKTRTLLTVLGVIIGTVAIVIMISLSIGIDDSMKKQLQTMGNFKNIQVSAGYGSKITLNDELYEKLTKIDGIEMATPVLSKYVTFSSGRYQTSAQLEGIKPEALPLLGIKLSKGEFFKEGDELKIIFGGAVINGFVKPSSGGSSSEEYSMSDGFFVQNEEKNTPKEPNVNVMEDSIKLTFDNDQSEENQTKIYRPDVLGIIDSKQYNEYSYKVLVPLDTMKKLIAENQTNRRKEVTYQSVILRVKNIGDSDNVIKQVKKLGLQAESSSQYLKEIKKQTNLISLILGGIGAVSMLVAALGITNTMVMSIYERTKEIGIMKVLGAALGDIGTLFIVESSLIGLCGGIVGIGFSYGASAILNRFSGIGLLGGGEAVAGAKLSIIPIWLVLLALVFTAGVGLLSGLYPAKRAMKLSALEAMNND